MIIITTSRNTIKISKHKARVARLEKLGSWVQVEHGGEKLGDGWNHKPSGCVCKWSLVVVLRLCVSIGLLLWLQLDLWNPICENWRVKAKKEESGVVKIEEWKLQKNQRGEWSMRLWSVSKGYLCVILCVCVALSVCVCHTLYGGGGVVGVCQCVCFAPLGCVCFDFFLFFFNSQIRSDFRIGFSLDSTGLAKLNSIGLG